MSELHPQLRFVAGTVGREIARACALYLGNPTIYDAFMRALPTMHDSTGEHLGPRYVRRVELRWWWPGQPDLAVLHVYEVSHPLGQVVLTLGAEPYEADGPLPTEEGLELQVAVLFYGDEAERLAVEGYPRERYNQMALDDARGALTFGPVLQGQGMALRRAEIRLLDAIPWLVINMEHTTATQPHGTQGGGSDDVAHQAETALDPDAPRGGR